MDLRNIDPIGVYAAIVATFVFIWDIIKFLISKRKIIIRVECLNKDQVQKKFALKKVWINPLRIIVTNQSSQNCTVNNIWVDEQERITVDLPKEITAGGSYIFEFTEKYGSIESIALSASKKIRIQTSDGKVWSSASFPFLEGNLISRWWEFRTLKKYINSNAK